MHENIVKSKYLCQGQTENLEVFALLLYRNVVDYGIIVMHELLIPVLACNRTATTYMAPNESTSGIWSA